MGSIDIAGVGSKSRLAECGGGRVSSTRPRGVEATRDRLIREVGTILWEVVGIKVI